LGYGVIGSPTDSGSVSLGSSPGTPAVERACAGGSLELARTHYRSPSQQMDIFAVVTHGPVV